MQSYQEIGNKIIWLEEVDSTNNYAKKLIENGEEEGTMVLARKQTRGRGREDRNWISPEGGLYLSLILKPPFPVKELSMMTLLTAVVVLEAIEKLTGFRCQVKWPNDLLLEGRKVCGVLTESKVVGEAIEYVVVGVGVNVNNNMEELSTNLQYPATSLQEKLGYEVEISMVLREIILSFNKNYKLTLREGWSVILKKWKENLYPVGEIHRQNYLSMGNQEGELA
ncbi:MAG: Bifunctional ligase/repressor BirA [candidate division WS2 bacterium]|uniref:Bifunctional ligase/repressor BirA n=1 Tax=Psychracetigena formicireducens TaxID=2986056 RepID=A0A9E2F710_PSYF1|nr:Bifunctional ligase/repressor BirA [Candidatus Psychracetigena formicireducens]MBT9145108.1 Bifunctional ligase/repressor BirA [Candidatus Psychracetigena formicireducens]MBT9150284.1 Bifunctional ligase/repressor BirA [Candidatus Psychracetigena formicireducens]